VSMAAYRWAEEQRLPANYALVLRTIAISIGERGNGWLSQGRMASRSNQLNISTVKRALRDLRDLGVIIDVWAHEGGHRRRCYRLNLDAAICWDGKEFPSWSEYLKHEKARIAERQCKPQESRAEFVQRLIHAGLRK